VSEGQGREVDVGGEYRSVGGDDGHGVAGGVPIAAGQPVMCLWGASGDLDNAIRRSMHRDRS
jgi:hypothetical protein